MLLGDFNAEESREDIFKPTIWNASLHEVRVVNIAKSKISQSKAQ
jgi:hypothetical protein